MKSMSEEHAERSHKREYDLALSNHGSDKPTWEDLTEAQREVVREANREFWATMRSISAGIDAAIPTP